MTNDSHDSEFAEVGYCPICGQGRQFVAREDAAGRLFVYCEECESEWDSPSDARRIELATHGKYVSCSLVRVEELREHKWFASVINK